MSGEIESKTYKINLGDVSLEQQTASGSLKARINNRKVVICQQNGRYCAWPYIIAAEANGQRFLLVSFTGDQDAHEPNNSGSAFVATSRDGGSTWDPIDKVFDSVFGDGGRELVSFPGQNDVYLVVRTTAIEADNSRHDTNHVHRFVINEGKWVFEGLVHSPLNSRTPTRGINGEIFHAYRRLVVWDSPQTRIGSPHAFKYEPIIEDPTHELASGASSEQKEEFENTKNEYARFSESHAVQAPNGMLVQLSRFKNKRGDRRLRQVNLCPTVDNPSALVSDFDKWNYDEARDGIIYGRTSPTELRGYPAHLLVLSNGWLLAVYADRTGPKRILAAVNRDTNTYSPTAWEDGIVLSSCFEGHSGDDMGYPCSVELQNNDNEIIIFTAFYRRPMPTDVKPCIMGISWSIKLM